MFSGQYTYILCLMLAVCLSACTPYAVREAQAVVAEADSLWQNGQMYGMDAGDSATLAETYETLKKHSVFSIHLSDFSSQLSDTYAHACYHYGRLLRKKDNPVEAMQAFISATHTRTRDYHILGRVYSNMGSICHLASEYDLSYDMYEKSAEMFLRNGDTINYYYALNDMAFELAEQGCKEETLVHLNEIEKCTNDYNILTKVLETKAIVYLYTQQYDSAVHYAKLLLVHDNNEPTGLIVSAQAYSFLGEKDSAACYAQHVLKVSQDLFHQNNAFYILTNDAKIKNKEEIREIAANRADVQKLLEIRQGKLSQATQLLEQDLNKEANLTWLYAIIITALISGGIIYWKNKKHNKQMHIQIERLIERQSDSTLHSIKQHIDINDLNNTLHWKNYSSMKADADLYMGGIVSKLENKKLNETEIRFCLLTMLDLSLKQIADTIHYSYPSGIKTLKKRISIKLGTTPPNLHEYLLRMSLNVIP